MKKLIGILVLFLTCVSVSAQYITHHGHTERREIWKTGDNRAMTVEEQIYDYGFYSEVGNIRILDAHFIANGRVFMLCYEPLDERIAMDVPDHLKNTGVFEAELFLYSKDLSKPKSNWKIASVEKIAGEYKLSNILISIFIDARNYRAIDCYMYGGDIDIGKVMEYDDGNVEIIVSSYAFENGSRVYSELLTFVFTPVDDKHYIFVRK